MKSPGEIACDMVEEAFRREKASCFLCHHFKFSGDRLYCELRRGQEVTQFDWVWIKRAEKRASICENVDTEP